MDFSTAVQTCFSKFIDFTGRARRSEYWYFFLFSFLVQLLVDVVTGSEFASGVISLALFLPSIAVGARRLHDTGRSGWWLLLGLIPILGWIVLLVFLIKVGDAGENEYGFDPLDPTADPHGPAQHNMEAEPTSRTKSDEGESNEADEDNPWIKARKEKAEADAADAKAKETEAKMRAQDEKQKQIEEQKKRRIEPPKFGRDAAKKDK